MNQANKNEDFSSGLSTAAFSMDVGSADATQGGEFNSNNNFPPGTNAVSQVFKEGEGSGDNNKRKLLLLSSVLLAVGIFGGTLWYMNHESSSEPAPVAMEPIRAPKPIVAPKVEPRQPAAATVQQPPVAVAESKVEASAPALWRYDEEARGVFVKVPDGTIIEASRSETFSNIYVKGVSKNGGVLIPNPPVGKIFWRVHGTQTANLIKVLPPVRLGLQFKAPTQFASGAQLMWSAAKPHASFFRVEFASDAKFENLGPVFATQGMQVATKGVPAGDWFVRLAGFNRKAGGWEYSAALPIKVQ